MLFLSHLEIKPSFMLNLWSGHLARHRGQAGKMPAPLKLVFIGGGHSHVIVLKNFGLKPLPGVQLTLITSVSHTPYSGMLPGHIAGFYRHDQCHINLRPLAKFAQASLYIDQAIGLDLKNNQVLCASGLTIDFDVLSIDIGSTPAKISVSGAAEYAIAAKPVPQLLQHWQNFRENVAANPQAGTSIAVVGGGAGGVELTLAMQRNLQQLLPQNPEIHLFQRSQELMSNYHPSMRYQVLQTLNGKGIQVHLSAEVCQIMSLLPRKKFLIKCASGLLVECDQVFWVTQASAPDWLKASGLGTDPQGFVFVDNTLRSLTHSHIFAAGDIATMINHPLPKAGVFAVRQGKPLFENLQRYLLGKPLKPYQPQVHYLSLIGTADHKAIANRGALTFPPHYLWWCYKDYIDRRFMNTFQLENKL